MNVYDAIEICPKLVLVHVASIISERTEHVSKDNNDSSLICDEVVLPSSISKVRIINSDKSLPIRDRY